MRRMTDLAHSLGLTAGWYGNNCACHDHCSSIKCFAGDVNATLAFGFDSIKLDGCGKEEDVALWAELFNHSIRSLPGHAGMMIENCHNGGPAGNIPHYNGAGELICPYHTYRSSTDIRPVYGSILVNLMSIPPLADANLSVPGCWAYPDMLEVGVTNTQNRTDCGPAGNEICKPLSKQEARTHFFAWCITSSPLTLGMDFSDSKTVAEHWETITNPSAIAINQDWAGHSGSLFDSSASVTNMYPCSWWQRKNCSFANTMSWYKPLSGSDSRGSIMAILLMNNVATAAADISFLWHQVPGLQHVTAGCTLFDVESGTSLGAVV